MILLVSTWQIIRRHPYLIPAVLVILVWVAIGYVWQWVTAPDSCSGCIEGQGRCLVACERVSRRLAELDRHPCTGCPDYKYGCDNLCMRLQRWELRK